MNEIDPGSRLWIVAPGFLYQLRTVLNSLFDSLWLNADISPLLTIFTHRYTALSQKRHHPIGWCLFYSIDRCAFFSAVEIAVARTGAQMMAITALKVVAGSLAATFKSAASGARPLMSIPL